MNTGKQIQELERVQRVYKRRAARDYGDLYTHFNAGNLFTIQDREKLILSILRRAGYFPLKGKKILEVGCGSGFWLRQFVHWGADPECIWGVEVDAVRAREARRSCPAGVHILISNGANAPLRQASFDLVFQSTVFTSILDEDVRRDIASEMLRLVKPDGLILWYDFRFDNPRNRNVKGIKPSEVRKLFPNSKIGFYSVTLAPFLARAVAPISWWACSLLNAIPFLRTHILAVMRPTSGNF